MANETTNYLEGAIIDYFLRPGAAAPHRPTTVRVCLLVTITDGEAGTVTEASYTGYAAQDPAFGASANNAGTQQTNNPSQISFPANGGGTDVVVVGAGIKDDLGNWLYVKTFAASVTYHPGDTPVVNASTLTVDVG